MAASADLVVRGGTVVTERGQARLDIGIRDGRIVALEDTLPAAEREIDAAGRLVLPGGIDSHCHIEQLSGMGVMNADDFASGSVSAAFGGTTTTISFACQHRGQSLKAVVADYHERAAAKSVIDYAFHMILTDPTDEVLNVELPKLVEDGHGSIKLFTTYPGTKLDDGQMLDVMAKARELGAMICVHAENDAIIQWMVKRLLGGRYTEPRYHAVSHPRFAEIDAIHRLIQMSAFLDQPVTIFHVSTAEGAELVRQARASGLKIYAETCPQYLFFTWESLDRPGLEGAKWMFSPPPRHAADSEALWRALVDGTLQTVTSDHAPYRFDASGKLKAGPSPTFKEIANGIPGLELRLPLLFSEGVSAGRLSIEQFVRLTATEPARLYGLHPRKGDIVQGADADLVLWDARREVVVEDGTTHDATGYTPYAGMTLRGWPETVLRRGEVIVEHGRCLAERGSGTFLPRAAGPYAAPSGRLSPETDPARNFGARILA
ncbi:dihydropyrimidinase [Marinivivus vitaminiproducens]|uniref:dihydropyrimidinase n=1 Tax=Marinivivus vitaminiproducens TaxID=3035935 RepID=UPI0027A840A3|nr:dihydropyrimidinase [Geminicoccaceae bacterium SCSIO 64248]